MAVQDEAVLRRRLAENDAFFCRMVNLVPADLYLPKDDNAAADANAKYFKVCMRERDVVDGGGGGGWEGTEGEGRGRVGGVSLSSRAGTAGAAQ